MSVKERFNNFKQTAKKDIYLFLHIFTKVASYIFLTIAANYYLYCEWKTNQEEKNKYSDNYKNAFILFLTGSSIQILRLIVHTYKKNHISTRYHDRPPTGGVGHATRNPVLRRNIAAGMGKARVLTLTQDDIKSILNVFDLWIGFISSLFIAIGLNYYFYSEWKTSADAPQPKHHIPYEKTYVLFLGGSIGYIVHLFVRNLHVHNLLGKLSATPILDAIFSAILL